MKSHEKVLCGNCEQNSAVCQCTNCESDDSFFCDKCWSIHKQVKLFKSHERIELSSPSLCCNCEKSVANVQCIQCDPTDGSFCLTCAEVHSQVKAFKNHRFITLDPKPSHSGLGHDHSKKKKCNFEPIEVTVSEDTATSILDSCYDFFLQTVEYFNLTFTSDGTSTGDKFFESLLESIGDITHSKDMDMKTVVFGFSVAFVIHLLVKLLLGKNSIFVIIAVGMFGVRWLRRRQHVVVSEVNALETVSYK